MKLKEGVIIEGLHISMRMVMVVVEGVYIQYGHESVITSGKEGFIGDGVHSLGSYHYYGMALDYRTRFLKNRQECLEVVEKIRQKLGNKYTAVYEGNHIHIQYNWGKS